MGQSRKRKHAARNSEVAGAPPKSEVAGAPPGPASFASSDAADGSAPTRDAVGIKRWWAGGLLVAGIGFLLYANTLGHGYALDDSSLIKENVLTRRGVSGIPAIFGSGFREGLANNATASYRPLPRAVFALQWQLAPSTPALGHWVNVGLYALTGLVLFLVLRRYLPGHPWTPLVAALIFIVHPLHTEVVANIKSLDEILCLLLLLLTMLCAHRQASAPPGARSRPWLVAAGLSFLAAALSKESAIAFVVIIPLWLACCPGRPGARRVAAAVAPLVLAAVVFYLLKGWALHGARPPGISLLDNFLVGVPDWPSRFSTAICLLGRYAALLFVPHPLVCDYSFRQLPMVSLGSPWFLLSLVLLGAAGVWALIRVRRRDAVALGVLTFFISAAVVANVVLLIGTAFAERLMYVPSMGFAVAVAGIVARFAPHSDDERRHRRLIQAALLLLLAAAGFQTITRNAHWRDNLTLFTADVKRHAGSARLHFYLGSQLSQVEHLAPLGDGERIGAIARAEMELRWAVAIHPAYDEAHEHLGKVARMRGDRPEARRRHLKALELSPDNPIYHNNYGSLLSEEGDLEQALREFEAAIRLNPRFGMAHRNKASVYLAWKRPDEAITSLSAAVRCDPGDAASYLALGMIHQQKGDATRARAYLETAKAIDSRNRR